MDTNSFFFITFCLYSLSYYVNGSRTVTGGVSEVGNEKDRSYYASKALQELEKLSDNSNARKIVEVSIVLYQNHWKMRLKLDKFNANSAFKNMVYPF